MFKMKLYKNAKLSSRCCKSLALVNRSYVNHSVTQLLNPVVNTMVTFRCIAVVDWISVTHTLLVFDAHLTKVMAVKQQI